MRKIKFRGKRLDNGRWVIGNLLTFGVHTSIATEVAEISMQEYEVDPSTIGQFTGLLDKNGNEIYEGDIIFENEIKTYWRIRYDVPLSEWRTENIHDDCDDCELNAVHLDRSEIIGNIHDNHKLIK